MAVDYWYCIVHRKSVLPEDLESHKEATCQLLPRDFESSTRPKPRMNWTAKSVSEKMGMKIYNLPKVKKSTPPNTLPANAVLLNVKLPTTKLE